MEDLREKAGHILLQAAQDGTLEQVLMKKSQQAQLGQEMDGLIWLGKFSSDFKTPKRISAKATKEKHQRQGNTKDDSHSSFFLFGSLRFPG